MSAGTCRPLSFHTHRGAPGMRRPRFGSVLAAAAICMAGLIPMFAAPAGAAVACATAGEFLNTFAAQSGLKVACNSDAGDNVGLLVIHDATNVDWHHGAARTFTMTGSIATGAVHYAGHQRSPSRAPRSRRRTPVTRSAGSTASHTVSVFPGGAFITAVAGTTATLSHSRSTATVTGPVTATIEYTDNRWLTDGRASPPDQPRRRDRPRPRTSIPCPALTPTGASPPSPWLGARSLCSRSLSLFPVAVRIPTKGPIPPRR